MLIACFLAASAGDGGTTGAGILDAGSPNSASATSTQSANPPAADAGSVAPSKLESPGDAGTATVATPGDAGSALFGDAGTLPVSDAGTPLGSDAGTPPTGDAGTSTDGDAGTPLGGDAGTPLGGDAGTPLGGDAGTPLGGDAGPPPAGDAGAPLVNPTGAKPRASRIPKDPGIAPDPPQLTDAQLYAMERSGRRYWSVAFHAYYRPFFSPPPEQGGLFSSSPLLGLTATLHNVFRRSFNLDLEGSYAWASGNVNSLYVKALPYSMNSFELSTALSYDITISDRIIPYVGVRIGVNFNNRSFTSTTYVATSQTFTGVVPGIFLGARYRVTPRISIGVRARVAYQPFDGNKGSWLGDFGGFIEYAAGLK